MFVSINWLKNYVDISDITPEELAEKITKSGIEVEGIEYLAEESTNVVVGYVETCEQHPNADKLSLCEVNTGEETLQIICGAPNIAKGQKVAVAKPGAVLPGNFKIKKAKLRGVESNGMICSLQELGIDEKFVPKEFTEGIFVFPENVEVGADVSNLLNINDAILELGLTPNRSDALSMLGVAYEVGAILDKPVQLPDESYESMEESAGEYVEINVEAKEDNPYYGAFIIKDVEIKQAPLWMRNYLIAAGIRPINNVVDITNYVLLEYGQPLHAFDFDKFGSKQVVVRKAKNEETIETLDDQVRKLNSDHLLITNGERATAIAGVMGGADSEVTDSTTTVLLEAAYFSPKAVRKSSKDHGLRSESSTRFEKGVDPDRVRRAGKRACHLFQQYAEGKVLKGIAEYDELDRTEKQLTIETDRINNRLGTAITNEEIGEILRKLAFSYDQKDSSFTVSVPTRRQDITIFEDMLEEVARIHGYDNLPFTFPQGAAQAGGLTERQQLKRRIKQFMESAGLTESITYSLTSDEKLSLLISPEVKEETVSAVELAMPMSEERRKLRLSLLPEMLESLSYNYARKQPNLAYYETGSIFISVEEETTKQPNERQRLSVALTGEWLVHPWQQEKKAVDFYLLKGIIDGLADVLDMEFTYVKKSVDGMHPGRTAQIFHKNAPIGFVGQVHPKVQDRFDLKDTYVFDLDLEYILDKHDPEPAFEAIPRFPTVSRDIALVVDESVTAGDIRKTMKNAGGEFIKRINVFDLYQGEHLPTGKKSLAFNLLYINPERTLKDEEVEASYQEILKAVKEKHNAELRG